MVANNSSAITELREMVKSIEKLQAKSTSDGHSFLAYLLDMSRMEAVSLLHKQRQQV